MATAPKVGARNWNDKVSAARSDLRKQRKLIRDYLDSKIAADLLLTRLITLNTSADEKLEELQKFEGQ